ncbi:MAG: hypothetical protein M1816_005142 [Peltula sp. TS41687]|nr:MAG: hypothetical protein M1816_005142 [Peltula sp. TS41687]
MTLNFGLLTAEVTVSTEGQNLETRLQHDLQDIAAVYESVTVGISSLVTTSNNKSALGTISGASWALESGEKSLNCKDNNVNGGMVELAGQSGGKEDVEDGKRSTQYKDLSNKNKNQASRNIQSARTSTTP